MRVTVAYDCETFAVGCKAAFLFFVNLIFRTQNSL